MGNYHYRYYYSSRKREENVSAKSVICIDHILSIFIRKEINIILIVQFLSLLYTIIHCKYTFLFTKVYFGNMQSYKRENFLYSVTVLTKTRGYVQKMQKKSNVLSECDAIVVFVQNHGDISDYFVHYRATRSIIGTEEEGIAKLFLR